jgi:hypothetical protein
MKCHLPLVWFEYSYIHSPDDLKLPTDFIVTLLKNIRYTDLFYGFICSNYLYAVAKVALFVWKNYLVVS